MRRRIIGTFIWLCVGFCAWALVLNAGLPLFSRAFRDRSGSGDPPELYWVGDNALLLGGLLLLIILILGLTGLLPGTKRRRTDDMGHLRTGGRVKCGK